MHHVKLGRTGLRVSELCLGTMTFGLQCDEDTSFSIMDAAFDAGIDFLDTADVYPLGGEGEIRGRTEEIVGKWMKGKRDQVVIATKCVGPMGGKPWHVGMSRKHVLDAIDESLRRLQTDYVDLYQLHADDPSTPLDEVLGALDTVVQSGRARYVGVSNWLAYRLALAVGRSEARGLVRFDSVQPRYNLLFRQIERELLPLCAEERIGVIPYNPIAGGMLTGKHARGEPTEGTRFTLGSASRTYQDRYWHEGMFETVDALQAVAGDAGLSLTTLAVAWVLAHPAITSPIIGASRPEQLDDTIAAADAVLDDDVKSRLDELTTQYRMGDAAR